MMKRIDPKYLGVPNICFSLTEKEDDREKKYAKQRIKRGFDDSETWCLASTIARFILPRLKRFKDITIAYPGEIETPRDWSNIVEKMIVAFELVLGDDASWMWSEEEKKQFEEGMDLFKKWYLGLWW